MVLNFLDKYRNFGLLLLRIGIGASMLSHGIPKILGGTEKWQLLGSNMQYLGITFAPVLWGFMASFAEFGGAILVMLGFFFRPALFMLAFTMFIATLRHINLEMAFTYPLDLCILFTALIFIGAGKYSIDCKLTNR